MHIRDECESDARVLYYLKKKNQIHHFAATERGKGIASSAGPKLA